MKFTSLAVLLCVGFAVARSSPLPTKEEIAKDDQHPPTPEGRTDNSDDDSDTDLLRAKKSATTTFCVEIKPESDKPAIVVCDNSKDQHQIPITHPSLVPRGDPQLISGNQDPWIVMPEQPSFVQPSLVPQEPLVYIPQQPQIFQPQNPLIYVVQQPSIPQYPWSYVPQQPQMIRPPSIGQPQVIFVRDPNCASNSPGVPKSHPQINLGISKPSGKSAENPMDQADLWQNGYAPAAEDIRSFSGVGTGASPSNALDLMYPRRGPNPAQQNQQKQLAFANGVQNSEGQFDRPLLIQCNPNVIPLTSGAYAAAAASNMGNGAMYRTLPGIPMGANQPVVGGNQAVVLPGVTQHQRQSAANDQPGQAYAGNMNANAAAAAARYSAMQHQMHNNQAMYGGQGRTVPEIPQNLQRSEMMSQQQQQPTSGNQAGGAPANQELGKASASDDRVQGQPGQTNVPQHQMRFYQQMGHAPRNSAPESGHTQEQLPPTLKMQQIKSSMSRGNMNQPFMMPAAPSTQEKSTQPKA